MIAATECGGAMVRYDAIVIGGGLVRWAIAYGLTRERLRVALVDEGDVAYRASRGNFGLVWVQSKGGGAPHYQYWTRRSADQWPVLGRRAVGAHRDPRRARAVRRRPSLPRGGGTRSPPRNDGADATQLGNFGSEYRMLDHHELAEMLPGLGPSVLGASWTPYDGHANPLNLLHALHKGFVEQRGTPPSAQPKWRPATSASRWAAARSARQGPYSRPGSEMPAWPRCSG